MKIKVNRRASGIITAVFLATSTLSLSARNEPVSETSYIHGQDSITCLDNTLLFLFSYEKRDFTSALGYWRQVFEECPVSSEDLYIRGESMFRELYKSTGEKAYIDTMLLILTQRTFYFNNKPSNDLHKFDLLRELGGNDSFYTEQSYSLIKGVADSSPDLIDHSYSVLLMDAAANSWSWDIIDTTEVLAAYKKAMGIVEKELEINPANRRYIEAARTIDSIFRTSGAMTCSSIEAIYAPKIDQNIRDTELIDKVFTMLEETNCTGSGFYYRIAAKLFADKRSSENAIRLAELNYFRNNSDKAIWYFTEAYKIDTNRIVRSDVLTRVASMELASGKKQDARNHGEQAWELNHKNGKALLVIAEAYAGSKVGDAFDNHAAYWVAVDYLKNAKALDPSLRAIADEKIKIYSELFPTREEGYYRGMTDEGVVYLVGGWINEVTTVRFRKE